MKGHTLRCAHNRALNTVNMVIVEDDKTKIHISLLTRKESPDTSLSDVLIKSDENIDCKSSANYHLIQGREKQTAMRFGGTNAIAMTVSIFIMRESSFAPCAIACKLLFCAFVIPISSVVILL